MTILRNLEVERIGGAEIEIRWSSEGQSGPVSVYEGSSPDEIDLHAPVAQTAGRSVVLPQPRGDGRRYYGVVPACGDGRIVADRFIDFEGISNFRDLGGYETSSRQCVKWDRVYRSGDLSAATERDLIHLSRLGIRTIFDLRHPGDGSETPDPLPDGDTRLVVLAAYNAEMRQLWDAFVDADAEHVAGAGGRELYVRVYESLVPDFSDKFGVVLRELADPNNLPAVVHCLSGQDRTGIVAAILLLLLRVPFETVMADYLLSNDTLGTGDQWVADHPSPAAVESFFDAREEYLRAGIDQIGKLYGSLEEYAAKGLGLSSTMLQRLRRQLLSPLDRESP